ncbi:flagellar hook assembly protein FlgD [Neobacillus massiliamazoniensis]|uniref:Flagellar hook capping protein n=1 Tax=Neobacillus massiliamazoniensis TaxID=1499688 RepID=A0A0U1NT82_9BACI|nr:flagellar hook assembly protein FlgD [Neobacillus massiliamazoniensis]CRK80942.1 flagellar hook capping protein [Neobacillus massiliamazoniensis]
MSNWVDVTSVSPKTNNNNQPSHQNNTLGKDDFLKILTTQLAHQDPSSPLDDKEFISQMATFSSLEQMTNLNTSFDNLANQLTNRQMSQFAGAIGKEISWTPQGSTTTASGIVDGISMQGGNYYYIVGNNKIPFDQVTEIRQNVSNSKDEINLLGN